MKFGSFLIVFVFVYSLQQLLSAMPGFGPRGGCGYCGCRKYKKQKGFTCSCGHNLQSHAEAQPTIAQQIAWQQYIFRVRTFLFMLAVRIL